MKRGGLGNRWLQGMGETLMRWGSGIPKSQEPPHLQGKGGEGTCPSGTSGVPAGVLGRELPAGGRGW